MRLTEALIRAARCHPARTATIFDSRRRTYAECRDRVARLAGGLLEHGAAPGDRIAILATNSARYYESCYAIAWAGCVVVPGNTRWARAEHADVFKECEPRLVLVDRGFVDMVMCLPGVEPGRVVLMDDGAAPEGILSFEQLIAESRPIDDRSPPGNALAVIFYTGGTTGKPKGVMLSQDNLCLNFLLAATVVRYETESIYLHAAPMFHVADAHLIFGATFIEATHVILPRFDPAAVVRAVGQHRVNTMLLVPTMIGALTQHLEDTGAVLTGVRRLLYGGSPISERLLCRAMRVLPDTQFFQAYGQTEASPVMTMLEPAFHVPDGPGAGYLRSAGRAIPGVDVKAVDERMREVPAGTVGEIVSRGPNIMLGYWRNPALTAQAIADGWLRTGDAGYLDGEGFLYLVDRVKDMIVSGGENVYSSEVENALASHPAVLECAVFGVPDERWGERVHAVVRPRASNQVSESELSEHCTALIASYKRPRSYTFTAEPLPLSGAGKVLKTELRKPFWERTGRRIN